MRDLKKGRRGEGERRGGRGRGREEGVGGRGRVERRLIDISKLSDKS